MDTSKVKISKAEAALWGYVIHFGLLYYDGSLRNLVCRVEHLAKAKKKQIEIVGAAKQKARSLLPRTGGSRQGETTEGRKSRGS